jgi:hypothetical protein
MSTTSIAPHIAIEKIEINGLTFNVMQSFTPEQVAARGRENTARVMKENKIKREIVATRGNGTKLYMINEFESGNFRGWEKAVA